MWDDGGPFSSNFGGWPTRPDLSLFLRLLRKSLILLLLSSSSRGEELALAREPPTPPRARDE
eukprot:scaffold57452_cov28-Tisochrysis_lutea.AAC.3